LTQTIRYGKTYRIIISSLIIGDGSTSTAVNPSHTYNQGGNNYTVSLSITNSLGQTSDEVRNDLVNVVQPAFKGEPFDENKNLVEGAPPLTVTFTDTSKPDAGPISGWLWNFGDGNFSTAQNPVHTYADTGVYSVTLTLTDTLDNQASITRSGYVNSVNQPVSSSAIPSSQFRSAGRVISVKIHVDVSQHPRKLGSFKGTFSWDPNVLQYISDSGIHSEFTGNVNTTDAVSGSIVFNGISTGGVDGIFDLLSMDLEVVGAVDAFTDLTLSYDTFESNLVNGFVTDLIPFLTITNSTFTVIARPSAQFSATPLRGYDPLNVSFTDQSVPGTGTINFYDWSFGDGGVGAIQNPTHTYEFDFSFPEPVDSFDVRLVVGDSFGESDTLIKTNYIIVDRSFQQAINQNWNLIGLPVRAEDKSFSSLYSNASSDLFGWNGNSYVSETELTFGDGYWIQFPENDTIKIPGPPDYDFGDTLKANWNIISGPSGPVAVNTIFDPEQVIVAGTWFGWNNAYVQVDTLKPGKGYWVQAADSAVIAIFTDDKSYFEKRANTFEFDLTGFPYLNISSAEAINRKLYFHVTIDEPYSKRNFTLPPLPPANAFDARFDDGTWVSETGNGIINIQSGKYPLTISSPSFADNGYVFIIRERNNLQILSEIRLTPDAAHEISNPNINRIEVELVAKRTTLQLPQSFEVKQNYPNPFNPSTTIRYAIPHTAKVDITIYNALGQKVKQLMSKVQEAGYYEVRWNGTNQLDQRISSGVYYLIVKYADELTSQKMLMLK
jgi:PKD repeat protein